MQLHSSVDNIFEGKIRHLVTTREKKAIASLFHAFVKFERREKNAHNVGSHHIEEPMLQKAGRRPLVEGKCTSVSDTSAHIHDLESVKGSIADIVGVDAARLIEPLLTAVVRVINTSASSTGAQQKFKAITIDQDKFADLMDEVIGKVKQKKHVPTVAVFDANVILAALSRVEHRDSNTNLERRNRPLTTSLKEQQKHVSRLYHNAQEVQDRLKKMRLKKEADEKVISYITQFT